MKRFFVTALLLLIAWIGVEAQVIQGIVRDQTGAPLPYATVKVLTIPEGKVLAGGVTKEDGAFSIEVGSHALPVRLEASLLGYGTEQLQCMTFTGHQITLRESVTLLDEVSVTANRIRHKLVAGGVSTAIEASPLANLSDIYSVLRGVPLIEVEGTNVKVTGKGSPVIYVNDRLVTDPHQLRTLKPYLIKDIQVITNPGARYSSSAEAVLKIYTKRELGSGWSGEAKMDLYDQLGSPLSYLPSARLNYRLGQWDFFATAMFQDDHTNHSFPLLQTHGKTDRSEWINTSQTKHMEGNQTQAYTIGVNYEDELQSAGLRYRIASEREDSWMFATLTSNKLLPTPALTEVYFSKSQTLKDWNTSHRPNLYYLRKIGQWKAQVDLDYYQTNMSHATEVASEGRTNAYELPTISNSHGAKYQSVGTRLDASGPLGGGTLNLGGEYSWVHNKFYNQVDQKLAVTNLDTELREQLFTLYLEYNRQLAETWHLTAGLRMEHLENKYMDKGVLDLDKSRTTTNVFPTFAIGGKLWGINTEFSFRSKIDRPTYLQLQPQYLYVSRYEYKVGDPTLKDGVNYSTALTLNKSWFTMILSHTYSQNCLTPQSALFEDPATGEVRPYITLFKTVNAPAHHGLDATAVASPTIKWWRPTLTLRLSKMIGYDLWNFDQHITHRKPTLSISLSNQFELPYDTNVAFNVGYTPFGNEDNMEYIAPILNSYGEISKKWLKDKSLLTTFSVTNIFNTTHSLRVASRYSVMESREYVPPRLTFTISYRFNTTKDKYRGTGALESVIERM